MAKNIETIADVVNVYGGGSTSANGWTCYECGNWVPNGITHSCATQGRIRWMNVTVQRLSDGDVERIAKRVAELLKESA